MGNIAVVTVVRRLPKQPFKWLNFLEFLDILVRVIMTTVTDLFKIKPA